MKCTVRETRYTMAHSGAPRQLIGEYECLLESGHGAPHNFRVIRREGSEAETERREKAQSPRIGYPGAEQMMRWQRDYK